MTVEYWYMFPAAVVIATVAMASGVGGATFFSLLSILSRGRCPMIRATIFDLDGTLVQTERLKALSCAHAAVELCPHNLTEAELVEAFKEVVERMHTEKLLDERWVVDNPDTLIAVVQGMFSVRKND